MYIQCLLTFDVYKKNRDQMMIPVFIMNIKMIILLFLLQ